MRFSPNFFMCDVCHVITITVQCNRIKKTRATKNVNE
jgi:hypothetical protein